MMRVHLDFETRSRLDITKVGGCLYAAHPSTSILCLAYAINDDDVVYWERGTIEYYDAGPGMECEELAYLAADPEVEFAAHNAAFEQAIWESIMVRRYGLMPIPRSRWVCTAAKAATYGLPRKLEKCGAALDLTEKKDMDGHRVMQKLSRPRKPSKANPKLWWEPEDAPEDFEKLYAYNVQDVIVEREIDKCLRDLSPMERRVWQIDQRMNQEGVRLDLTAINRAVEYIDLAKKELVEEFVTITEGDVQTPNQHAKLMGWLEYKGLYLPDLQAPTIDKTLDKHKSGEAVLADNVHRILQIRRLVGKKSVAKYPEMIRRSDEWGILRDILLYYAAHTGRWGGRGVQLQNLPRPQINVITGVDALLSLDYEGFHLIYDDIITTLSYLLKGMIISHEGYDLLVADFAQIEARVLAWLAGQLDVLDTFARGDDIYCVEASKIYCRPITKDQSEERQVGKVSILALGYEGGIAAFGSMAKNYRVDITPVYDTLWYDATVDEREKAEWSYHHYLKRATDPMNEKAAKASDIIKQRWRVGNPKIVQLWKDLNNAAIEAVCTRKPVHCGRLVFFLNGAGRKQFLHCKLPSGRPLSYHMPSVKVKGKGMELRFWTENPKTFRYEETGLYGGILAENITQAVSRDLLAEALVRLEDAEYPGAAHIHDEVLSHVPEDFGSLHEFEQIMVQTPAWAKGLPIKADGWRGKRYKKG